jgi:predicted ribosomally synthesized peptide with SipW-like signal peptide
VSTARTITRRDDLVLVPARRLHASRMRKLIGGLAAFGTLGALIGTGTFASFTASTTNAGNVFATGEIALSNAIQSGTTCLSGHTGAGEAAPAQSNLDTNGNGDCDALFDLALRRPGDTATASLAIANTGDYDGELQLYLADGCENEAVGEHTGSANLCTKLEVYIQETNSDYSTPVNVCVFPASTELACDTGWSASSDSLADLASSATAAAPFPSTPMLLPASGLSTRYFQIRLKFPDTGFDENGVGADNAYQNRRATFDLVWRLREA